VYELHVAFITLFFLFYSRTNVRMRSSPKIITTISASSETEHSSSVIQREGGVWSCLVDCFPSHWLAATLVRHLLLLKYHCLDLQNHSRFSRISVQIPNPNTMVMAETLRRIGALCADDRKNEGADYGDRRSNLSPSALSDVHADGQAMNVEKPTSSTSFYPRPQHSKQNPPQSNLPRLSPSYSITTEF